MNETLPGLPLEWIKKIFMRFNAVYGPALMRGTWGEGDLTEVWNVWSDELKNFRDHGEAIKYALHNLPKEYPPNLLQFKDICREGLKHEPKPLAIEEKMTPERLAKNKLRVRDLLRTLAREKRM